MTEITTESGERRVKWGTVEWVVAIFVTLSGLGGVGSGYVANITAKEMSQAITKHQNLITALSTKTEALSDRVEELEKSGIKWDDTAAKLERIDERTTRTAADVQQILREIRGTP